MNIPYITNGVGWTFFIKGKPIYINSNDPRYDEITAAVLDGDNDKLEEMLQLNTEEFIVAKIQEEVENFDDLKFRKITNADGDVVLSVTYKTLDLPKVLSDKLIGLWKSGCQDFSHFFKFIDKLLANHSTRARNELYTFLESCDLPITQDGNFIAYKGLMPNFYSLHGNNKTRVISGEVNNCGQIKNTVGSVISVVTEDVDTNCNNYCSCGLHVGSYKYARSFGNIVVAVEVDPSDVVSVPLDYGCEKCRVSSYKVLNVVTKSYTTPDVVVDEDTADVEETKYKARVGCQSSIDIMLSCENITKTREGILRNILQHAVTPSGNAIPIEEAGANDTKEATTVAQLCGSVGRKHGVTRAAMIVILLRLGFNVDINTDGLGNSLVTE